MILVSSTPAPHYLFCRCSKMCDVLGVGSRVRAALFPTEREPPNEWFRTRQHLFLHFCPLKTNDRGSKMAESKVSCCAGFRISKVLFHLASLWSTLSRCYPPASPRFHLRQANKTFSFCLYPERPNLRLHNSDLPFPTTTSPCRGRTPPSSRTSITSS